MSVGTRGTTTTVPGIRSRGAERRVRRSREDEGVGTGWMRHCVRGLRDAQLQGPTTSAALAPLCTPHRLVLVRTEKNFKNNRALHQSSTRAWSPQSHADVDIL